MAKKKNVEIKNAFEAYEVLTGDEAIQRIEKVTGLSKNNILKLKKSAKIK